MHGGTGEPTHAHAKAAPALTTATNLGKVAMAEVDTNPTIVELKRPPKDKTATAERSAPIVF